MPIYLVISQAPGSDPILDHIVADSPVIAAQMIRDEYGLGLAVFEDGSRPEIKVGLIEFEATGTIIPDELDPTLAVTTYMPRQKQPAIVDLTGAANLLAVGTKVNAILAMLRNAGIIDLPNP